MTRQTDTDWICEGAKVAVYTTGHAGDRVQFDTVERLTGTQIVLAGRSYRFRRDTLQPVGARGTWDTETAELIRPDDQRVIDLRARVRLRNLANLIGNAATAQKGGVADVLAALNQMEQAVAETRASVKALAARAAITETTK